jgi:hypothetical protein
MASSCWWPGRIEAAVGYSDTGQLVIGSGRHDDVPFGLEGALGAAYLHSGQPERQVEWCRARLAFGRDTHGITRAFLTVALTVAGRGQEARAAANGLIEVAEATGNPAALSFALYAYGYAFGDADPAAALNAQRRGLVIAQESGNRNTETRIAGSLARLEAEYGDPLAALDYVALAIRNFHDAGNTTMIRFPLAVLAAIFDRLGRDEPAATIAGFAHTPLTATANPEFTTAITDLRHVLGNRTYESLARRGDTMTTAAMVTYAYDQIDHARIGLTNPPDFP